MKKPFNLVAMLALVSGVVSCAPVKLLNAVTSASSFEKDKNLSYGDLERQKLDIYNAQEPRLNSPVIIFVHGGSWDSGNKNLYKFLAQGFTAEGFDVVVPNYRLYPDVVFPAMIEDTGKAIAYAAQHFSGRELVVMGHSAGAYNSLMTLLRPEFYPGGSSAICSRIAGVVAIAPPTGTVSLVKEPYITIFPERFTGADAPMQNAQTKIPPVLFVHGLKDTVVYPQESQMLADKITERGGSAKVKTYAELNHIGVIKVTSKFFDGDASVKTDVIDFIDSLDTESGNFCR